MMALPRISGLLLVALSMLPSPGSHAANSVMIWPIDPKINSDDKAAELWLENRGTSTTLMQVRVFQWQQNQGQEQFQTQQQVMASPPMVRIEPGKRQQIRLIKQVPPAAGQEIAYRIVLDEIPTPHPQEENNVGLNLQMRYSVPLFVYGAGLGANNIKPTLSWRLVNQGKQQAIEITNRGNGHVRLSNVSLGGRSITDSLMGYVLANGSHTFTLPFPPPAGAELSAQLGTKGTWRSSAER
ncbi:fimbrial biogenesis chaperone [Erwinia tasmaniensis]|uniref:CsuC protein, similar to fimbrial chaperone proteins (Chaperone-usher pili assembly system) n=1 Tax=Erwinia tasmaniensis (strain DSM 17950 / CFBP 7177 / CIP 109463 / NCPPB 4357 / Et1/99) TaxID=465817 RepID=B2VGG7_ERWT9|nr:molecular chaperone [Erwinia tasmaniensis]CAO95502.1 CsuC protein, similar to fimbrial chaperone proteins (chaperone-usher pili assembly system) [Erwinia tasmaniensis Et1/99]